MSNWRPDGWKNPYKDPFYRQKYEAGADAMYEALKKTGDRVKSGWFEQELDFVCSGWLVFIPERQDG